MRSLLEGLPGHALIFFLLYILLSGMVEIFRSLTKSCSKRLPLDWITEVEGKITWQFRELICKNLEACSFQTLIGWLVTAPLLQQDAPFWFEMLKKLVTLRGTVAKPKAAAS